jgi:hypothetical protein
VRNSYWEPIGNVLLDLIKLYSSNFRWFTTEEADIMTFYIEDDRSWQKTVDGEPINGICPKKRENGSGRLTWRMLSE